MPIDIEFENVYKKYRLGQKGYSSLREDFVNLFRKHYSRIISRTQITGRGYIWALNDVSFRVEKGTTLGIIGPNGSGKSTILKLLANITAPNKGKVSVKGRIAALIELGAGFHPELTGRENIYLNGSIMGMKKREINKKFDSIVNFAELGNFVDTPVKRYSSGMYVRLGFSVAVHNDADVLLIDEALSVGDTYFQNKCFKKMEELRKSGKTMVFVSHNLEAIRNLCDEAILLNKGKVEIRGLTSNVIEKYYEIISQHNMLSESSVEGVQKAKLTNVKLLNCKGEPTLTFSAGDEAILKFLVEFNDDIDYPAFGFFVRRSDGLLVFDTTSKVLGINSQRYKKGTRLIVEYKFKINLLKGTYHIGSHVEEQNIRGYYDYIDNAITFNVTEKFSFSGIVDLRPICEITLC